MVAALPSSLGEGESRLLCLGERGEDAEHPVKERLGPDE